MGRLAALVFGLAAVVACQKPPVPEAAPIPAPPPPQVSGSIAVEGLSAPVTIVRDRSGIPHITAASQSDLFFAQGFVQAQDRLFQIDLWRRSVQGRLSEVLGANFIERDAMTRRIQYRGSTDAEWASYGPDAREIATAFTRGINAWIAHTSDRLPEEFALAGWVPDRWAPEDLLNRTEAFLASNGAMEALLCARLIQSGGARRNGSTFCPTEPSPEVDLSAINGSVANMLRRVGPRPFFAGLSAAVPGQLQSEPPAAPPYVPLPPPVTGGFALVVGGALTASGSPVLAGAWSGDLDSPSSRYLVHLRAPGWNVIGATAPWRPGVAMGHNEHIAWTFVPAREITQQVFVERLNPDNPHQVATPRGWRNLTVVIEPVAVKGREQPFESEQLHGPHGPILALDRERNLAYAVRWSGFEAGGAAELGILQVDRSLSAAQFQSALERWRMPIALFAYGDTANQVSSGSGGRILAFGHQRVGGDVLVRRGPALVPTAGWLRETPAPLSERAGSVAGSSDRFAISPRSAVESRLQALVRADGPWTIDALRKLQHDVVAPNADALIQELRRLPSGDAALEAARARLSAWNGEMTTDSVDALLYVMWENRLLRALAAERIAPGFVEDFISPSGDWLLENADGATPELLRDTLRDALDDVQRLNGGDAAAPWGRLQMATFHHHLSITTTAARRYNVGPFSMPGNHSTVFGIWRPTQERSAGPVLQLLIDVGDWDRSRGIIAPGQSAVPGSPHFADLAPIWARGEDVPLPFSEAAVAAAAENTLVLAPR